MNATTYNLITREIEKRQNIIAGMNNISNWTSDMESMEKELYDEITDLTDSLNELMLLSSDEDAYINSQY